MIDMFGAVEERYFIISPRDAQKIGSDVPCYFTPLKPIGDSLHFALFLQVTKS
jgi:hypothetical protein